MAVDFFGCCGCGRPMPSTKKIWPEQDWINQDGHAIVASIEHVYCFQILELEDEWKQHLYENCFQNAAVLRQEGWRQHYSEQ